MKHPLPFVLIITFFLYPSVARAQDNTWQASPILELQPGKKLMKVAELEMPDNISLQEILRMFPELIARDGEDLFDKFDLQIDDVSSGASKEALLTQLRAADIKEIEVSVNPNTSTQTHGQGGVINITLNSCKKGFTGNALLEASSTWDVIPAFKFSYGTPKVDIHGMISGEYYNPRDNNSITTFFKNDYVCDYSSQSDNNSYGYQLADLTVNYRPDDKNTFKFWARESFSSDVHNISTAANTSSSDTLRYGNTDRTSKETTLIAGTKYKHLFTRGELETQLDWQYVPQSAGRKISSGDTLVTELFSDKYYVHTLSGYAKGKYQCIPSRADKKCELTAGLNFSYNPVLYSYKDSRAGQGEENLTVESNTFYISPYVQVDARIGTVFLKGAVRYQYYDYYVQGYGNGEVFKPTGKVTAFLNFGWQPAPHHHLSMILDKSIKRPGGSQVYPGRYFDPNKGYFITGNPDLKSSDIYTASVSYQYDLSKNGHTVLAGADLKYDHISNVIAEVATTAAGPSFCNAGNSDVIAFCMMAMYGKGPFKVFVNSNLIQNWSTVSDKKEECFSYNINVTPMLSFPNGNWRISGAFEYNSPVKSMFQSLGKYFYSEARLSKGFGKWTVYLKLTDNFHRVVEDIAYNMDGSYTIKSYYLHFPGLGIGGSLNF